MNVFERIASELKARQKAKQQLEAQRAEAPAGGEQVKRARVVFAEIVEGLAIKNVISVNAAANYRNLVNNTHGYYSFEELIQALVEDINTEYKGDLMYLENSCHTTLEVRNIIEAVKNTSPTDVVCVDDGIMQHVFVNKTSSCMKKAAAYLKKQAADIQKDISEKHEAVKEQEEFLKRIREAKEAVHDFETYENRRETEASVLYGAANRAEKYKPTSYSVELYTGGSL